MAVKIYNPRTSHCFFISKRKMVIKKQRTIIHHDIVIDRALHSNSKTGILIKKINIAYKLRLSLKTIIGTTYFKLLNNVTRIRTKAHTAGKLYFLAIIKIQNI